MIVSDQMASAMIRNVAPGLASYAVTELLEAAPESDEPQAFASWHSVLRGCLEELAVAVDARRPEFFAEYAAWVQTLLTARGLPDAALKRALGCLAKVVAAELPDDGGAPARSICEAAQRQLDSEPRDVSSFLRPDTMYGRLAAEYLLAVLEGDRLRASRLILDAATDPRTIRDLYLQVLLPAQAEVGRMWQVNEINVAEEHFASATTKSVLAQLRLKTAPLPANGKAAITAAVEGNHHDIGLQAVADFLEMAGWRVIQLSSDVPIPDLVQAVDSYAADLLALSVSLRSQLPALQRTIEAVRRGPRGAAVRILVGGRALTAADDLARQYGADACGVDPASAVALSNSLVGVDGGMAGA